MWGRPLPPNEQRTRLHLPIPADLATLASALQSSDPPVTSFAEGDEKPSKDAQQPPDPFSIDRVDEPDEDEQ